MSVRVYDLAHSRAGDKGNTSNISVICYEEKDWEFLQRELTPERVMEAFKHHRRRSRSALRTARTSRRSTSSSKMPSAAA